MVLKMVLWEKVIAPPFPRQKPLLSKKNVKAHLSFARKHLDNPQDFWENTLDWRDNTVFQ